MPIPGKATPRLAICLPALCFSLGSPQPADRTTRVEPRYLPARIQAE
jgi:hypothetical protein